MKFRSIAILLVIVVVLTTIGPAAAQSRKIATVIYTQELDSLNPMYSTMTYTRMTRDFYLYGAWHYDEDLNPVPTLAAEIPSMENGGISEDGTVITIKLRDDINWSDGEPITSADFLFTYEMITSDANTPLSRYPYTPDVIESVEAPDPTTVVVNFAAPFAPWLTSIFQWVLPRHVLEPVFEAEGTIDNAEWNRAPTVSSGPFVFQEWEVGSHILFVRNENFFGEMAKLDGVFVRFVPDDAAQTAALIAGDGDIAYFLAPSDVVQVEETGNLTVSWVPAGYNEGWFFNVGPDGHPALQDVRVRHALAMAVPREQIIEDLLLGFFEVPASFWEGTPYQSPNIAPDPFDPEAAAALLDEAGWVDSNSDGTRDKDGVELVLRYLTPPRQVRMDTQVVVQQALADVGVGVTLENPSYDIFWNSYGSGGPIATGQYDIGQWSSSPDAFPDPDTASFKCNEIPSPEKPEGNNWNYYCNPDLDALFEEQARTTDLNARIAIWHQITEIMSEDLIWMGMWTDPDNFPVSNRMVNVKVNGSTPFWNAYAWDIAE
ncbi:MAG: peptide ABC transporter substrate-binding protein [Anaerolineae bacterium]